MCRKKTNKEQQQRQKHKGERIGMRTVYSFTIWMCTHGTLISVHSIDRAQKYLINAGNRCWEKLPDDISCCWCLTNVDLSFGVLAILIPPFVHSKWKHCACRLWLFLLQIVDTCNWLEALPPFLPRSFTERSDVTRQKTKKLPPRQRKKSILVLLI